MSFLVDYKPNSANAKSASQIYHTVAAAVKNAADELRQGIVGSTKSDSAVVGNANGTFVGGSSYLPDNSYSAAGSSSSGSSSSGYAGSGGNYSTGVAAAAGDEEDPIQKYMDMIQAVSDKNNAWAAEQAQKQMDFQERLSNSAHQREMADLKAAGLNPVLTAMGGSGASTPSGAMAQPDTSNTREIANLAQFALESMATTAVGVAAAGSGGYGSRAGSGSDTSLWGKLSNKYANDQLFKKAVNTSASVASKVAGAALIKYALPALL